MKKKILIILGLFTLILIGFGFYKVATLNLFEVEPILVEDITVPKKDYRIRIYKIPSNATLQPSIQIRKIKSGQEDVLSNYERYDKMDSFSIKIDTLILSIRNVDNIIPPKKIKYKLP